MSSFWQETLAAVFVIVFVVVVLFGFPIIAGPQMTDFGLLH